MLSITFLALLGTAVGLALHLRWHPLRREFSDAWDFLRLRQPLVLVVAGLLLLRDEAPAFTGPELEDWRGLWPSLLGRAFTEVTELFHALLPPWPLALVLPLGLLLLTIRVWRWPYRYGERVPVPEQKLVLVGLSVAGVLWAGLEIAAMRVVLPEWLESVKLAGRVVFAALTAAGTQVWLSRLVMAWERPSDTEADRDAITAHVSTFARWQSVVLLGAFNFLWMLGWSWRAGDSRLATWLLPELWLLFAALPLCVALAGGQSRFWMAGAMALKVLLRSLPAMIGYLLTAVVAMALVRYATDLAASHFSSGNAVLREVARVLAALVLAMLRGWLCLAAIFVMLRHGFPRPSPAVSAA
jgi:hypothetical protein